MDERTIDHEHLIEATPDTVWEALTSEDGLDDWLGPGTEVDLVPGGEIATPDIVSDRPRRGRVDDVDPQRRFAFTWWPAEDEADRSNVVITLEPVHSGTLVRVVERSGAPLAPTASAWGWRTALMAHRTHLACRAR